MSLFWIKLPSAWEAEILGPFPCLCVVDSKWWYSLISHQHSLTLTCNWIHSPLVIDLSGHNSSKTSSLLYHIAPIATNKATLLKSIEMFHLHCREFLRVLFGCLALKYQRQHSTPAGGTFLTISVLPCQDQHKDSDKENQTLTFLVSVVVGGGSWWKSDAAIESLTRYCWKSMAWEYYKC